MALTTDKDPRILVAELAFDRLNKNIYQKSSVKVYVSREKTKEIMNNIRSDLMKLKYSYLPSHQLPDHSIVKGIFETAKELYQHHSDKIGRGMSGIHKANAMWAFRILSGLPRRFRNPGEIPCHGVDIFAVKIRNTSANGNFTDTKCFAGPMDMTIVTNIVGLKPGDTLAAALLPPAIVGGTISEAMFLGEDKLDIAPGTFLKMEAQQLKEADGILFDELRKLG